MLQFKLSACVLDVQYQTFTNPGDAKQYVKDQGAPIVVKADGLAAGKGVVVAMTLDEAFEAIDSMLVEGSFGSAGSRVIIEEFLEGEEASFFALVDGETALPLESASWINISRNSFTCASHVAVLVMIEKLLDSWNPKYITYLG